MKKYTLEEVIRLNSAGTFNQAEAAKQWFLEEIDEAGKTYNGIGWEHFIVVLKERLSR